MDHSVDPVDEGRHEPGPEQWWNESWYLDFVDRDGELAGYVRLGLHPNQGVAWWTAAVVGKDRPCVMSTNYTLPLPDAMSVHADDVHVELVADALKTFHVKATAPAMIHATADGVYDGSPATETTVVFDLTWTTDGVPYHYVVSPRYEIPCTVSGSLRVGDEEFTVNCRGQRDHSWANRDWWSFEWCWFAGWLEDDNTKVHGADIRLNPDFRLSFGYRQHDGDVVAIESDLVTTEALAAYGMPTRGTITCAPAQLELEAEPIAFGPLLLVDPNGQRAHFNRAATRFTTRDGRAGFGWIEWNQVQGP